MTIQEFLTDHSLPTDLPLNGEIQRPNGDAVWFIGRTHIIDDKEVIVATCGDWRTGEKWQYESTATPLSPEEKKKLEKAKKKQREIEEGARTKMQEETALACSAYWQRLSEGTTSYVTRKGLASAYGARVEGDHLSIPMRDIDSKVWGLQAVTPAGEKQFMPGMKVQGCFFAFPGAGPKDEVYIAEGWATAASIYEALGKKHTVLAAFTCHNLLPVGKAVRGKYPTAKIIFCADNDQWTTKKVDGEEVPWNAGVESAKLAASAINNSYFVVPVFKNVDGKPTDFNDLHTGEGLEAVRISLTARADRPDLLPVLNITADGKIKRPEELQVVKRVLDWWGTDICRSGDELFIYQNNYWRALTDDDVWRVKRQFAACIGATVKSYELKSALDLFKCYVKEAPRNPRLEDPTLINFLNGTLHIEKRGAGSYETVFRPHARENYLMRVLPYDYTDDRTRRNHSFELMISNTFEGDVDCQEKVRAVKQLYGAALCPMFPRLFMFVGPPNSGKSALIKPLANFVSDENLCGVDPTRWREQFSKEIMAGKLVNLVTDLDTSRPISDNDVKLIEDRPRVYIDRKNKTAIQAYLPALHVFGANSPPPTREGSIGAHRRRWTYIECNRVFPEGGNREMSLEVFQEDPIGVLNMALEGLADLLASKGIFANPASGVDAIVEWEKMSDPCSQFLDDLRNGEFASASKIAFGAGFQIERKDLYAVYLEWNDTFNPGGKSFGKKPFLAKIRGAGFKEKKRHGKDFFDGLGHVLDNSALC